MFSQLSESFSEGKGINLEVPSQLQQIGDLFYIDLDDFNGSEASGHRL